MIGLVVIFGAMIYPQYALTVAHANDFAAPDEFVKIAGGLLLLLGVGTMVGPFLAALAMEHFLPEGLFAFTAICHLLLGLYTLFRMSRRGAPPGQAFRGVSVAKGGATQESVALDPRSGDAKDEDSEGRPVPTNSTSPRSRGAGRGAAPRRGGRAAAGDNDRRARGAAFASRDIRRPGGGACGRKPLAASEKPTDPATDDELAPPTLPEGGTEPPR